MGALAVTGGDPSLDHLVAFASRRGAKVSGEPNDESARSTVFRSFHEAAGDTIAAATLSRETLDVLGHAVDELVLADDLPASILVGLQEAGHRDAERARYEQLGRSPARSVTVFAAGDPSSHEHVSAFALAPGHPLGQDRFLLVLTDRFCAAVVGREFADETPTEDRDRRFAAIWTFDPELVTAVCRTVQEIAGTVSTDAADMVRAALQQHPPRPAPSDTVQRFTNVLLQEVEADRQRWRRSSIEFAAAQSDVLEHTRRRLRLERSTTASTLASAATHELNNPLASIAMAASALSDLEDAHQRTRMTEIIREQALRAGGIASTLSTFVDNEPLRLQGLDLAAVVDDVVAEYRSTGVRMTASGHGSVHVITDPDRLRQSIVGVIDERAASGDRTAAGDPAGTVDLDLEATTDGAVIGIVDHGPAIPSDVARHLFGPWLESEPGSQMTRLGFAIARSHVAALGGTLELRYSRPGESRFEIRIPRGQAMPEPHATGAAEGGAADGGAAQAGGGPDAESGTAAPSSQVSAGGAFADESRPAVGRVLVVDDEAPIRGLLEALLRRDGWEVVGAADGSEALEAVRSDTFDIALVDVRLGDGDGVALLEELAEVQPDLAGRTGFMTGAPPESGEIAGCPVLGKPFSWRDLSQLVEDLRTSG